MLIGCNPFADFHQDSSEIQKENWAKSSPLPSPLPVYCYKTIADPVCYDHPIVGKEEQLSGDYSNIEGVPDDPTPLEKLKKFFDGK